MKKVVIILGLLIIVGVGGVFIYLKFIKKEPSKTVSTGVKISIPNEILENKFGFLAGGPEAEFVTKVGAAWARPHPGPFLWDSIQSEKNGDYYFQAADQEVEDLQKLKIGVLATIWPFADWDQKNHENSDQCKVSENDIFLPQMGFEKDIYYLPQYRCNPNDWEAYAKWIKTMVERYDGDGTDDMPNLEIPIKYWEVMNEPDLASPEEESELDFYSEDPDDYAELLIKTHQAIKEADPGAKVLIAGAAGGNDRFLNFYREVFKIGQSLSAFDIANVHCISNDNYDSFNVEPYKKMLEEFGIDKPIWVTEAEAMISSDPDINATQTLKSTEKAIGLGAERIFYTSGKFEKEPDDKGPMEEVKDLEIELEGKDFEKAYQTIIGKF